MHRHKRQTPTIRYRTLNYSGSPKCTIHSSFNVCFDWLVGVALAHGPKPYEVDPMFHDIIFGVCFSYLFPTSTPWP